MAADDIAGKFDNWYAAMAGSHRRDEIVQRHLGLPRPCRRAASCRGGHRRSRRAAAPPGTSEAGRPGLWSGRLRTRGCRPTGASLIGLDFSVEAIRQADSTPARWGAMLVPSSPTSPQVACRQRPLRGDMYRRRPARLRAGRRVRRVRRVLRPGGRAVVGGWEAWGRERCLARVCPPGRLCRPVRRRGVHRYRRGRAAGVGAEGTALRAEAATLDRAGDDAVAALRDEVIEVRPCVPLRRRVLASVTAPRLLVCGLTAGASPVVPAG